MPQKSTRKVSSDQEEFLAEYLGARTTPNSGATWHTKGDLHDNYSVFEAKTSMTQKKSYTLKKEDLVTLERVRKLSQKQFGFFVFDYGNHVEEETYVTMRLKDFYELYRGFKDYMEEEPDYDDCRDY